jgi:hypothetical protein
VDLKGRVIAVRTPILPLVWVMLDVEDHRVVLVGVLVLIHMMLGTFATE